MNPSDPTQDPIAHFGKWFREAEKNSGMAYPNAMSLASVDGTGQPSVRIVLLRDFSAEGFVFYTNYESKKGQELTLNPRAALCFHWDKLERQVRIEGSVKKISREASQIYFQNRPRQSQIGAWASAQSREIPSRSFLMAKVEEMEKKFSGIDTIPVPDFWGGFVVQPKRIEFWEQGDFRLHNRLVFEKKDGGWSKRILSP